MFCTILTDPINSNPFRFTSLDYAVSGNQHHIVEYMIEKKLLKGYEMKDAYGMSIFHRAAKYSDVEMLGLLLDFDGMPHWYGLILLQDLFLIMTSLQCYLRPVKQENWKMSSLSLIGF